MDAVICRRVFLNEKRAAGEAGSCIALIADELVSATYNL